METVPLITKSKVLPNLDATPLLRELFQDEFQAVVPARKLPQNILTSLKHHQKKRDERSKSIGSKESLENCPNRLEGTIEFSEHVLEAYKDHEKKLQEIRNVEQNLVDAENLFLKRQKKISENPALRDMVCLRRQPLLKALDVNYVRKYKLLQGDVGLPLEHEAKIDFRVQKFKESKKRLESLSIDDIRVNCIEKRPTKTKRRMSDVKEEPIKPVKIWKLKSKDHLKNGEKPNEIFASDPKILFFTNYKLGYVYIGDIKVKNTSSKPIQFQLKPMQNNSSFKVALAEKLSTAVSPGLGFQLIVEFTPKSLDNAAEDIVIVTEDGNRFLIPLIAYLEPPILKTHKEINEFTKITSERIASSYIECGSCFTGDSKVIKLNFRCYRGSGEFFIMSVENWSNGFINTVTFDNLLEIPPFRVYPVYFKVEKDEIIDLFVEFTPKHSGMQVENIIIACDNGQTRSIDLIGDAVAWHSHYFSFQDSLVKELSVKEDDDVKVKYFLDFGETSGNGKVEKVFCVSNNSDMTFEFQWKIREANIISSQEKYLKLSKYQVKIDPENGTFEPKSIWEFLVTITSNNAEVGNYRMVLSLYVLNLPYQCIEEDNTIIQPTGLVRNLYSQSLYGEEEASALSPELTSLQGTYESLQESIKSYMEFQNRAQAGPKQDFCRTVCVANPGLCAKPLKKSKTLFNIGETLEDSEGLGSRQLESNSESCTSNRDDKMTEMSPQRNEVIWDFVDILVDEVELWVEVVPTRVTLQPSVVELTSPIFVNGAPHSKEVRIINHNRTPVTCSWVNTSSISTTDEQQSLEQTKSRSATVSLLFDKSSLNKAQTNSSNTSENQKPCLQSARPSEENELDVPVQREESSTTDVCEIIIQPYKEVIVHGLSETTCKISILAYQPGKIKETFWLNVNDGDLRLKLIINGQAVARSIETSPDTLDFGVLKQGTRYTNNFTITSQTSNVLCWKINHYKFDFKEEKFFRTDVKDTGSLKKTKGVIVKKGDSAKEPYCLDARVPGIKCSLIEVEESNCKLEKPPKHYVMVLADVKIPKMGLSAPRFENCILAPSGIMYVGQKYSTKVTLTNYGNVETVISWGVPFGCHCRKLKVEINPNKFKIEKKRKMSISFELTPLEEGIVNHCYIPCFFSRNADPLILSIVALIHNVNVTFEILDYPMQNHMDTETFINSPSYHTILRIPWPVKMYNPTLGFKYLTEVDILNINCHCQAAEEEANRAFECKTECKIQNTSSEKSMRTLRSLALSDSGSRKSKTSSGRNDKFTYEEDHSVDSVCGLSGLSGLDSKKFSEDNSVTVYTYSDIPPDALPFNKSHLEFINVPFRTPTLRQFIIRNETRIATNFQITVYYFGVSKHLPDKRLETIKNRVFGISSDEFQNKLSKDQPLVFDVEPSKGELKPLEAVCINVHCYGNTWGEYRDFLICQIKGLEPFHLRMFVQIVGHPLYFPIFKSPASKKATLRFQPLSPIEKAAWKQIKVVNRSAIPLKVSWMVFITQPILKTEGEDVRETSIADSNANAESNYPEEESTQSNKNYIPRNTNVNPVSKDCSQASCFSKTDSVTSSVRKEKAEPETKYAVSEETKTESQFQFPGTLDVHTFQINPREMSFEPFEEKNLQITFNPEQYKSSPQEVKGVLTSCVKLKPEHENYPGVYYRPCGISFVSELMDFIAGIEFPIVSFEILKGDLTFIVDANAVLKSENKTVKILRKFIVKNLNQKALTMKIDVIPGTSFRVKTVNTIDKFYPDYNPMTHFLHVDAGHILEMELQCEVSYKIVMYAFEQLKINRTKETCSQQFGETKRSNLSKSSNENEYESEAKREPWKHYKKNQKNQFSKRANVDGCKLGHNDSFHININRMSSRSDTSTCFDQYEGKNYSQEFEGECFELPCSPDVPCKHEAPKHIVVSTEEITFIHSGSIMQQNLVAELQISFPAIKITPKCVDFGNVYLGETALRYCSLTNITGFPMDFRVLAKFKGAEFAASPLTGSLPSTNYNSDIGKTITIKFTPSQPGYYKEIFQVYCNLDLDFDCFELFVSGLGTWNEKYKTPKYETYEKLERCYAKIDK